MTDNAKSGSANDTANKPQDDGAAAAGSESPEEGAKAMDAAEDAVKN